MNDLASSGSFSLTWLWLVIFAAPLLLLAWWKRIFPHTPFLIALIVPCAATSVVLFRQDWFVAVLLMDAVIVAVAVLDALTLPALRAFSASRDALHIASVQSTHPVTLQLTNHSGRTFHVWVRDDVPQEFERTPREFSVQLAPRSRSTLSYTMKPGRRGAFQMNHVYLRVRSLLGLWRRFLTYPVETAIKVYPDMKQLSEYAILARTNRLSLMGVRRTRKVGTDNEFERLRDYTLDDNYKHIDWRSTARRNKLTVKDFQTSQSQRIIFMLDCGRMMTNEAHGLSLLDHSLNAMLMLAYVALEQGDSVGLICFSDQVHTYIPPRGGKQQMNKLLHASYNRFPRLVESRYDDAFFYLSSHCKKRSLVVMVSNLIDEVNANQLHRHLSTLVGRHLPLGVLLRDHRLFDAADTPNPRGSMLFRAAAAADILLWRHQVLTDLTHQGVRCLDVFPEQMTAPLVNEYLKVKARHLL